MLRIEQCRSREGARGRFGGAQLSQQSFPCVAVSEVMADAIPLRAEWIVYDAPFSNRSCDRLARFKAKLIAGRSLFGCDKWQMRIVPVTQSRCLVSLITGLLAVLPAVAAAAKNSTEFDALLKESGRNNRTKAGYRYMEEFATTVMPQLAPAMRACGDKSPDTKEPATLVFIIAANGRITRIIASPDIPYGQCVVSNVSKDRLKAPPPPRDGWPTAIGLANHHHEEMLRKNAPKDNPVQMHTSDDFEKYDKAIAPYVAKARATYPTAKTRFLAGLPPGHKFLVRLRLTDSSHHREDSFVEVESIKGGKITGIVGRVDILTNYKQGQRITFSESRIDNWLILRLDGTEEGNAVGKFLDTYKPK
jgi:hypothetical protein